MPILSDMNYSFCKKLQIEQQNELYEYLFTKLIFQIPELWQKYNPISQNQVKTMVEKSKRNSSFFKFSKSQQTITSQSFSYNLKQLIEQLLKGSFDEFIGEQQTKPLQIYCVYNNIDGDRIFICGNIIKVETEISICLYDASKQSELSSQKIKSDFKNKIIESFSHEMRTPLNSANNLLETALVEPKIPDQLKQSLLKPAANSLKLQSFIINDIIDFTNYYSDSLIVTTRDFTFQELVSEISDYFKIQFDMKSIGLSIQLKQNQHQFKNFTSDYNRMMQVIANILQNSLKFSQQGNVIMKIIPFVDYVKISIKDDGIGIEQQQLQEIQETIYQFEDIQDVTITKQWHGFGLLISKILLSKLSPNYQQNLFIKSTGLNKGTKVIIIIENQKQIDTNQRKSIRFSSKQTFNNIQIGTVIISSQSSKQQLQQQFGTILSLTQNGDLPSEEQMNQQLLKLANQQPKLLSGLNEQQQSRTIFGINTQQTNQHQEDASLQQKCNNSQYSHQQSQMFSIKELKLLEDHQSENNILRFIKKRKCQCRRILSVDDEIFNQYSIKLLLEKFGFQSLIAYNGVQAIQIVKEIQKCNKECSLLDLIFMDFQMPIMNGIQTTKKLIEMIANNEIPYIPIVGLTAFTGQDDLKQCYDAGMYDVLQKPLYVKDFKQLLITL